MKKQGINLAAKMVVMGQHLRYLLCDQFVSALTAGNINGTIAEPGPGTRTVIDTENKLTISGGKLVCAGAKASPAWGDPRITYGTQARAAGRILVGHFNVTTAAVQGVQMGLDTDATGESNISLYPANTVIYVDRTYACQSYTRGLDLQLAIVLRTTGAYYFLRGDRFYKWRLVAVRTTGTTTPLYPCISNYDAVFTSDFLQIADKLWLPNPLVSDGFSAAASDGKGHAEGVTGGSALGQGGGGVAWSNLAGTWGVSGGAAAASALAGSIAFRGVTLSTEDVFVECDLTRNAGNLGIVLRYVDGDNYIVAYHDGTNLKLDKVVGGSVTNLASAARAYSAGARLTVSIDGARFTLFYNNGALTVTSVYLDDVLRTSKVCGLYTTDTGNTFDNFVAWARGSGGEYSPLNSFSQVLALTPDQANVINAETPCTTPTYDSSGEAIHPDVYDAGEGGTWNGHRYWMAMTPYTGSDSAVENPSILVSDDGDTWEVPDGLTNPVIAKPAGATHYNADPDITMVGSTLYMIWKDTDSLNDIIKISSSTDGITWSASANLITVLHDAILSPAIAYINGQFVMMSVNATASPYTLERRTCATINGTWSDPATIVLGVEPWHLNVTADGSTLYLFVNDNDTLNALHLGFSSDYGATWTLSQNAILAVHAGAWDGTLLYRPAAIKTSTGFDLWYSAENATGHWRTGRSAVRFPN